jgi:hypothetical protein
MDELTVTRDRELFRLKRKDQTWWIEEPFQSKANQSEVLSLLKKLLHKKHLFDLNLCYYEKKQFYLDNAKDPS